MPLATSEVIYNLRLPGQYYQSESGLNYNYNRDYDPVAGSYIQSDPLGLSGGSYSSYAYANGDPTWYADPFGLLVWHNTGTSWLRDLVPGRSYELYPGAYTPVIGNDTLAFTGANWTIRAQCNCA